MRRAILLNGLRVYLVTHVATGASLRIGRKELAAVLDTDEQALMTALGLLKATGGADFRVEGKATLVLSRLESTRPGSR